MKHNALYTGIVHYMYYNMCNIKGRDAATFGVQNSIKLCKDTMSYTDLVQQKNILLFMHTCS